MLYDTHVPSNVYYHLQSLPSEISKTDVSQFVETSMPQCSMKVEGETRKIRVTLIAMIVLAKKTSALGKWEIMK